jgi:hypothetical protein
LLSLLLEPLFLLLEFTGLSSEVPTFSSKEGLQNDSCS